MTDIKTMLASEWRMSIEGERLRRVFFADYVMEVAPEEDWKEDAETWIDIYVNSRRFSVVMERLFNGSAFPFDVYKRRKLIADTSGNLAMVLTTFRDEADGFYMRSGGMNLEMREAGKLLDEVRTPESMMTLLCRTEFGRGIAMIEGVYAYLYLAAESGLDAGAILDQVNNDAALQPCIRRWGQLKRPFDRSLVSAFLTEYGSALR
jgi:hypothetical protein